MHAESSTRWSRLLTILVPFFALAACGEGDGPTRIINSAVEPPNIPPGFCDTINFEDVCPNPIASLEEFEGGPIVAPFDNPYVDDNNGSAKVARMQKFRSESGATFGGGRLNLNTPFVVTAGSSFTMNVWSPRPVPVQFQVGIATVDVNHGGTGWEVLTFNLGNASGNVDSIAIIFDNGRNGNAGADPDNWTFYFDDIALVPPSATGVAIDPDIKLYDPSATPPIPVDVEVTVFGSQSVINDLYADDGTYSPVLAVSSGVGYGANIAQVGFLGGDPGFVTFFESLEFKVKGMPNLLIFVSLYEGGERVRINLSSSGLASALGDGWYQVSIPISNFTGLTTATGIVFESDDTAPMQFTMLLTDIGFTEADDGGNGGSGGQANLGVFSETHTDLTVSITDIVSAGNTVTISESSDPVFDGAVSLGLAFSTGGQGFGGAIIEFESADLSAYDALKFAIDTSAFAGFADLTVQLEPPPGGSSGNFVFLSSYVPVAASGNWQTYEIPLADFTSVDPSSVNKLGFFNARDGGGVLLAGTLYLDDIHFSTAGGGGNGGGGNGGGGGVGGFLVNGDFEDDLTGWTQTQVPDGVGSITADNSAQGGRTGTVARLVTAATASQSNDLVISQEALAAGTVAPGDSIEVSFELYGSLAGAGGVVFVEVIFLNAAGEDVGGRDFVGPAAPYTPTGAWTPYSGTVIAGTGVGGATGFDVSGGVVLSLKAACGPIDGCGVDASFDNVTFTIN